MIGAQFGYVVNPMMTGNLFDVAFEGQSSVVTRADKAPGGFVVLAGRCDDEEILVERIE